MHKKTPTGRHKEPEKETVGGHFDSNDDWESWNF